MAEGLGRKGTDAELSDMVTAARGAAGADATRAPQMEDSRSADGRATAEKLLTKAIMVVVRVWGRRRGGGRCERVWRVAGDGWLRWGRVGRR